MIGAIFDEDNFSAELAFQSAIYRENMYNKDIEFVAKVVKVSTSDTFAIEKQGKKTTKIYFYLLENNFKN